MWWGYLPNTQHIFIVTKPMKHISKSLLIGLIVVLLGSCNSENKSTTEQAQATDTTAQLEATDTMQQVQTADTLHSIAGKIEEIKTGKDGYTAKIVTEDEQTYFATISHVNLSNPGQYKSAKVGETIKVKGEVWKMENENHITVRELE
jgi:hypothetical protein